MPRNNAMLKIRKYTAAGLFGGRFVGFAMDERGQGAGADNCFWITQFEGTTFHLVSGADPICGTILAGKAVGGS